MPDEIGVTLKYGRRYNLGNYQHEDIEITLTGPYDKLKDAVNLVAELKQTSAALGALSNSVYIDNRSKDATDFQPKG